VPPRGLVVTRDRIIGWGFMVLGVFAVAWGAYELASGSFRPGSFGGKGVVTSHILLGLFGSYAPYAFGFLWGLLSIPALAIGRRRLAAARPAAKEVESEAAPETVVPRERSHDAIRRAYPTPPRKPRRKR
jgi:hypothetical protein